MAELKTQKNEQSVEEFLNSVTDERKRRDCFTVLEMMKSVTGEEPVMWGSSIVGFGQYHYRYESGREGDSPLTGFSPRAQNLTLYLNYGFSEDEPLLSKLGKFKTGKVCLYIKKLDDVDLPTLKALIEQAVEQMRKWNAS
jgi:nucleoid DNA-binding protein